MLAFRRIIGDSPEVIPIPPEFRHHRTEVIFMALDQDSEAAPTPTEPDALDPFSRFRGQGRLPTDIALELTHQDHIA